MPDLTAETLAMLDTQQKRHAKNGERSADWYAHAAACVRFVQELTNTKGLVRPYIGIDFVNADDERVWRVSRMKPNGRTHRQYWGKTPIDAFRAATQDHNTGGDDGQ